jgi:single-stranded-DNA-specific exonuclease
LKRKSEIPDELLIPEISVDAELNLTDINDKLIRILNQFEPYGPENMTPVFLTKNLYDTGYAKTLGQNDEHLKLFVKQNDSQGFGAIGFGLGNQLSNVKNQKPFNALYCIDENEYNGTVTVQLRVKDLK